MRKNRFQKIAESMKAASENPGPPRVPGDHGEHAPKQTVSSVDESISSSMNLSLFSMQNIYDFVSLRFHSTRDEIQTTPMNNSYIYTLFYSKQTNRLCIDTSDVDSS